MIFRDKRLYQNILLTLLFLSALILLCPFILSLVFGGMIACAFSPILKWLRVKGIKRTYSLPLISLIMAFALILPSTIFFLKGSKIISEVATQEKLGTLMTLLQNKGNIILTRVDLYLPINRAEILAKSQELATVTVKSILNVVTHLLTELPQLFLLGLIAIFAFYYFLIKEDIIKRLFYQIVCLPAAEQIKFIKILQCACRDVFLINILTGIIQASVVTIGAYFCGYTETFMIFFITYIVSFIPVIGAAPVALVLAATSFAQDHTGASIAMVIVAFVAGVSDNLLRPWLGTFGKVEAPAFFNFLAVIGGIIILGLPGLFLGPLIASLCWGLTPILIKNLNEKL